MKRLVKRLLTAAFTAALCFNASAAAQLPRPTEGFFVNDFANVISDKQEREMQKEGEALYSACGAQVVAVTVPSLEGEDISDYSLRLAREWEIGSKDKNDGILLLLSVGEPHVRIEVGSGLEGAIPDSKAGRILDTYVIPNYTPESYGTGLCAAYDALVNEVYIEYGLEPDEDYEPVSDDDEGGMSIVMIIVIILFVLAALAGGFRGGGFFGGFHGGFYGGGFRGGFSGGGGGFSGGGGGFSGGGGGFSGGGASR